MKRKTIILFSILIFLIILICLSIPTKTALKDGGTVIYKSVLWQYSKVNSLEEKEKIAKGERLYILGIKVKDTVKEVSIKQKKEKETIKEDTNKKVEARYYQFKTRAQKSYEEEEQYKYYEIELDEYGRAKIDYLRALDSLPKEGIYIENDKYIILTLNTTSSECYEGNYEPRIADSCNQTIVFIKDGDSLKQQVGLLFHFSIDNEDNVIEYKKVDKTELQTNLKD